jgi:two-component system, chemotaxis family, sensor kinase CheA
VTQFFDERGGELRELFFETAQELLQALNDDALKLEKAPKDAETIRSIRRTVHTLKGDAAACGFQELSELAHMLEDALAVEVVTASKMSLAELGFTAADTFGAMLTAYRQESPLPEDWPLRQMVLQLASGTETRLSSGARKPRTAKKSHVDVQHAVWTEYEKLAAQSAQAEGKKIFHIVAQIDPLCSMPIAARQLVANALGAVAQIFGTRPEAGSTANIKKLDLLVATSQPESDIISKCRIPTVISEAECFEAVLGKPETSKAEPDLKPALTPGAEHLDRVAAAAGNGASNPRAALGGTVLRVDAEKIDNVLNLVGELIIGKSMLQQVMQEYARVSPKDGLRARFGDAMGFQARVLNDLQRSVMKIRMVPVEQLFRRFPRIVRDAAQRCEKQVELVLGGQDTDLDKSLLDAIAEPLTHIVRNAVSHGLESPAERKHAGKPAIGKIRLDACHQANQLIVEVSDDGHGIDAGKIKAKAVKTGLMNPEAAERMSTPEVLDLIFRPGFSTADEITEVSGRGVGLDVVRSVLHRLKGTVELETHPGQGTRFRLKLPLTLAIIKALLFRVEHRLYAIPLNSVAEIARAWESDLHQIDSWEVVQLRGQALPLMRLGRKSSGAADQRRGKIFILVINYNDRKMGLIVDNLEGEEELVIKSLDDQTIATDLVSGASILGDGRVVLIMNLAAVVERFTRTKDARHSGVLLADADRITRTVATPLAEVQP